MAAEQMQHPGVQAGQPPRVPDQSAENHGAEDGDNGRDRAPTASRRSRSGGVEAARRSLCSSRQTMGSTGFQAAPSTYVP
jgi:hypothetical protein